MGVTGLAAFANLSKVRFDPGKIAALGDAGKFGGLGFKILSDFFEFSRLHKNLRVQCDIPAVGSGHYRRLPGKT